MSARRQAGWLALAALSLALFLCEVLLGLGSRPAPTLGSDGYSLSGLGHAALLSLLEERGVPLLRSRWASAGRVEPRDTLVLAEPEPRLPGRGGRPPLDELLGARAPRTLLVLPKRLPGPAAAEEPRWIASSSLRPLDQVRAVLEPLDLDLRRVERVPGPGAWTSARGLPPAQPVGPLQLLLPQPGLEPWLACEAGVLVGRVRRAGRDVVVLADPDPLAHHALGTAGNAAFALALLDAVREPGGRLVWDETWQGHVAPQRATPLLLEPPVGLVTASLALLALLALGAGMARLGMAPPAGATAPAGREALVQGATRLLARGDHREAVLRAYATGVEREALEQAGGARLAPAAARAALDARARARGLPPAAALGTGVEALLARGRPTVEALLGEAQRIHRWKEEVHHGRHRDP